MFASGAQDALSCLGHHYFGNVIPNTGIVASEHEDDACDQLVKLRSCTPEANAPYSPVYSPFASSVAMRSITVSMAAGSTGSGPEKG